MRTLARRIWADIAARRHVDAYVVSALTLAFGAITVVSDAISIDLRWAAALAGIGVLVYRTTAPASRTDVDELLQDRTGFEATPITMRLRNAREVWIFAPSGVNFLSEENLGALRSGTLGRRDGNLRVVVLNPSNNAALDIAVQQLDNALEFRLRDLRACLNDVIQRLRKVADEWPRAGSFEYRYLDYNPGFSLVAIDPTSRNGRVIVEFHGFHNETTMSRMHFEIGISDSQHWYRYWIAQFEHVWQAAVEPAA
jgi:hypothetical protein